MLAQADDICVVSSESYRDDINTSDSKSQLQLCSHVSAYGGNRAIVTTVESRELSEFPCTVCFQLSHYSHGHTQFRAGDLLNIIVFVNLNPILGHCCFLLLAGIAFVLH